MPLHRPAGVLQILLFVLGACAVPAKFDPGMPDGPTSAVGGRDSSTPGFDAVTHADSVSADVELPDAAPLPPDAVADTVTVPNDGSAGERDVASAPPPSGTSDGPVEAAPPPIAWELVTVGMGGAPANGNSSRACLSADGRYVVFLSDASNLIPGDTNGLTDVFRFDRQTKTMERVSVSTEGAQANKTWSHPPTVSGDGRFVVFVSSATNLVAADTNDREDLFMRDMDGKRTTRVSVSSTGAQLEDQTAAGGISGDGSQIVFITSTDNVVPNLPTTRTEAYLVNRASGAISRVTQGTESLFDVWISHDGRTVASLAYTPPATAGSYYLHEAGGGRTTLAGALGANVGSGVTASLSDDGRLFAFDAFGDPATGQTLPHGVYVMDRTDMKPLRISAMTGEGDPDSYGAFVSGDAQLLAFTARQQPRVFNRQTHTLTQLPVANGTASAADLSRDGRLILIATNSRMLAGSSAGVTNLYVAPTGR
jgi:hypothetical protein